MGISAYRKEYRWDWAKPIVWDAEEVSGDLCILFNPYLTSFPKLWNNLFIIETQVSTISNLRKITYFRRWSTVS